MRDMTSTGNGGDCWTGSRRDQSFAPKGICSSSSGGGICRPEPTSPRLSWSTRSSWRNSTANSSTPDRMWSRPSPTTRTAKNCADRQGHLMEHEPPGAQSPGRSRRRAGPLRRQHLQHRRFRGDTRLRTGRARHVRGAGRLGDLGRGRRRHRRDDLLGRGSGIALDVTKRTETAVITLALHQQPVTRDGLPLGGGRRRRRRPARPSSG